MHAAWGDRNENDVSNAHRPLNQSKCAKHRLRKSNQQGEYDFAQQVEEPFEALNYLVNERECYSTQLAQLKCNAVAENNVFETLACDLIVFVMVAPFVISYIGLQVLEVMRTNPSVIVFCVAFLWPATI